MVNKMIKLSVIIPVYNCENYLSRCLDSILNQTFNDYEVICINDGSNDGSLEILNKYSMIDKRIKVYNQKNIGVAKTRNKAIKLAKGKYIMFIDNDDFIDIDYFEVNINEIIKKKMDIVLSGYRRVDCNNKIIKSLKLENTKWSRLMIMAPWAKIYRKEFIVKNNIIFLDNDIGEDVYFNMQAMFLTDKIDIIDYIGYNWFYNNESVSNTKQKNYKVVNVDYLLDELYSVLEINNIIKDNYVIIEMFFIRYLIWFLTFSTKGMKFIDISYVYDKLFNWLKDRFPNYNKNKLIGLNKPVGEVRIVRYIDFIFMKMHKIKLGKLLIYLYSVI